MKILVNKEFYKDEDHFPFVGEEIMTPDEYVAEYVRVHGIEQAKKMRNSLWMNLIRQGIDNFHIDIAFKNNGIKER